MLIISMFNSVPGVPRVKMERFADVATQTSASPHLKLRLHAVVQRTSMKEKGLGGLMSNSY
jgi:hypothetical protein